MDVSKGSAAGTFLLDTGSTSGLRQHPTLSNENDMTIREFLLQFSSEPSQRKKDSSIVRVTSGK